MPPKTPRKRSGVEWDYTKAERQARFREARKARDEAIQAGLDKIIKTTSLDVAKAVARSLKRPEKEK